MNGREVFEHHGLRWPAFPPEVEALNPAPVEFNIDSGRRIVYTRRGPAGVTNGVVVARVCFVAPSAKFELMSSDGGQSWRCISAKGVEVDVAMALQKLLHGEPVRQRQAGPEEVERLGSVLAELERKQPS